MRNSDQDRTYNQRLYITEMINHNIRNTHTQSHLSHLINSYYDSAQM